MDINLPLVKLIPLWIGDLKVKGKSPYAFKPYAAQTLETYAERVKLFLSLDCDLSTESFKQYLDGRKKKVSSRTFDFEETALNRFFGWLLANELIKYHPNPDYKPRCRESDVQKS